MLHEACSLDFIWGACMHSTVIINGTELEEWRVKQVVANGQECICADGAGNSLYDWGIVPAVLVGDMDSINPEALAHYRSCTTVVAIPDQYSTDLEKALTVAIDRGATEITVVGAVGGRIDHTLTNLAILHKYGRRVQLHMVDAQGEGSLWVTAKRLRTITFEHALGSTISLIPFGLVKGVSTVGLKYPLHDEVLAWGIREGQSNVAVETTVLISFTDGALFVYSLGN